MIRWHRFSNYQRIPIALIGILGLLLPLHFWVYLPITNHIRWQHYHKQQEAIREYNDRLHYLCTEIYIQSYFCQNYETQKSRRQKIKGTTKGIKSQIWIVNEPAGKGITQ